MSHTNTDSHIDVPGIQACIDNVQTEILFTMKTEKFYELGLLLPKLNENLEFSKNKFCIIITHHSRVGRIFYREGPKMDYPYYANIYVTYMCSIAYWNM